MVAASIWSGRLTASGRGLALVALEAARACVSSYLTGGPAADAARSTGSQQPTIPRRHDGTVTGDRTVTLPASTGRNVADVFLDRLQVEQTAPDQWSLTQPLRWLPSADDLHRPTATPWHGQFVYAVPAGFVTDLASVPAVVPRWLFDDDDYGSAAALHDYLWRLNRAGSGPPPAVTDRVFRRALLSLGAPRWRAWVAWSAVRVTAAAAGRL